MPWWLVALAVFAGAFALLVGVVLLGLWHVARLLQADEEREREEWYPFADPD